MGQYTSIPSPTTSSNLTLELQRIRIIIRTVKQKIDEYLAAKKLHDEQYKELDKIEEMLKNPQPPTDPVEAEFERPILKNTHTLREELQKFAEFITVNMDVIISSPELNDGSDEVLFAQLVNSSGFEYARAQVGKRHSTKE
jgi:flagellar biosynthesis component FlhA